MVAGLCIPTRALLFTSTPTPSSTISRPCPAYMHPCACPQRAQLFSPVLCCLLIAVAHTTTYPSVPPSPTATPLQPCQPQLPCTHSTDESPTPMWRATATTPFPTSPNGHQGIAEQRRRSQGWCITPTSSGHRHQKLCVGKGSRRSACGGEGSKDCARSIYPVGTAHSHRNPSCDTLPFTVRALQGRCLGTGTRASGSALSSCSLQIRLQQLWGHSASFPPPRPGARHLRGMGGADTTHTHSCAHPPNSAFSSSDLKSLKSSNRPER